MAFKMKGWSAFTRMSQNPSIGVNIGGDLEGGNIDGEYYLSAEELVTPGIKRKLRKENPNIKFYGEHARHVEKNTRKKDRLRRRGKVDSWGDRIA
jgi:ribosome maturation factor RimP